MPFGFQAEKIASFSKGHSWLWNDLIGGPKFCLMVGVRPLILSCSASYAFVAKRLFGKEKHFLTVL